MRIVDGAIIAAVILLPGGGRAGNWHRGENLVCSDCHTMHGSQAHAWEGSSPVSGDPAPGGDWLSATAPVAKLLKASADQLCIACHDGTTSFAPDVIAPIGYVADAPGGAFETASGAPSALGHDLNGPPTTPVDGDTAIALTCRACHDPHGNANYRNLRPRPSGSPLRGDVTVSVSETILANGSNRAQVYVASNLAYRSGTSAWCLDCHSAYDPATSHHTDVVLYDNPAVDWSFWRSVDPSVRVRVENPLDGSTPNHERYDRVFCLSCHKAHGSPNPDALIYADGLDPSSTCNQCH